MGNLKLRGNGNINDNYSGFSSSYGNIGIGNRSHYSSRRSNPVNYVDRGLSSDNNNTMSSINSSSTTVCHNCLGSMSYDSIRDIWYCNKCSSNNKITTTATTSTTTDKPVMTGGRTQSNNAEQDDTTEHVFAVGHTKSRKEIQAQRQKEKEFGDTSDLDPYLKKVGGYIVRQETDFHDNNNGNPDWKETYSPEEWSKMKQTHRSFNSFSNTTYYVH